MFSGKDLRRLLIPLVIEQLLAACMGLADTMMVSNVGSAAISGVSLVDSINNLVQVVFAAVATGGTIVCAQYLGRNDRESANRTARQVLLSAGTLALGLTVFCVGTRRWLLSAVFGSVEPAVMSAALTYFLITALSYPALALYNSSAALYRAAGNSRLPMLVSAFSNLVNIAGNALLMFGFGMGVAGAALSTLFSRILAAVILLALQRRPGQVITMDRLLSIRPDFPAIRLILSIGIPTGIENSLFQVGKLAVQSTVSTLGTTAIAAQAIVSMLEYITSMPSMAIGLGLITVVGQCMGAGRKDEARRYTILLTKISWATLAGACFLVLGATWPVTVLAGLTPEVAALVKQLMILITFVKIVIWPLAFTLPNGMRAAGDVKFTMYLSTFSIWAFRVTLAWFLCRRTGAGILGVWIAMFADWTFRDVCYLARFLRGKWMDKQVLKDPEQKEAVS